MNLTACLLALALLASGAAARTLAEDAPPPSPDVVTITPTEVSKVLLVSPTDQSFDVPTVVHIPPGVPVGDVVFLSDTTGSMGGFIANVKANVAAITAAVTAQIPDVRFGVAEYKDFEGTSPFAYKVNTPLAADVATVQAAVNTWGAGGGGDEPEAQLFALKCLAEGACDAPMGFRDNAIRIVVWFGDAPGHDPSGGATKASAIAALVAANIQVIAIDLRRLNVIDNQATDIAAATDGLYTPNNNPATLSQTIIDAIKALSRSVTLEPTCEAGLTATYAPPSRIVAGSDTSADLDYTVSVTLVGGTAAGEYQCVTAVLINDVVVDGVTQTIKVRANRPPDCAAAQLLLDNVMWPPNHDMIGASVAVTDPDGDAVTVTITAVAQSEGSKATGSGNTCPDATVAPLALRRERVGSNKGGRIYKVSFSAKDVYGATCDGSVLTCVPHDQGQGEGCDFTQPTTFSPACPRAVLPSTES